MQDAAIAIIEDPHHLNHYLWIKRRDLPIWVLPGGGIDAGETPEETVCRESLEETGLTVTIKRKAAQYSPVNHWTSETHVFICERKQGFLEKSAESEEVKYFHVDTPPYPCFPLHVDWIQEARDSPDQIIKRPLNDLTWRRIGRFFLSHPLILIRYLLS